MGLKSEKWRNISARTDKLRPLYFLKNMPLRTGCTPESIGKKVIIWLNFATCTENIGANYPDAELYSSVCGGGHQSECHISESPPPLLYVYCIAVAAPPYSSA